MVRTRAPMDPSGELLTDRHWPVPELYYYPPDKFIAIHRTELRYIGAGECATLWRAVQTVATGKNLVFGTTIGIYAERVYDCFTDEQLHQLWINTMKQPFAGENIREACLELGTKIKPIPVPEHLLAYDPQNPPDKPINSPICTPVSRGVNQEKRGRGTQPTTPTEKPPQGTKTGLVWDIADDTKNKYPAMAKKTLKDEVTRACVKQGINPSTAQVQFGKWWLHNNP